MKNEKYSKMQLCAVAIALCTLTACNTVSLSKEQCISGNWQAIGYNDGVAGRSPSRISEHQEACAETGIIPNFLTWEAGRKEGLVHYCTEANALSLGQRGQGFNAVCPASQVSHLQNIHKKAYNKYKSQQKINSDKRKLTELRKKLSKLRGGDMLDFKTESEAREYMLRLQKEITELETSIKLQNLNTLK